MLVNINELNLVAQQIIEQYADSRLFALEGEMGAGKTTFSKELCKVLGVVEEVNSPTFAIANVYPSAKVGEVFHFDFYRLNSLREALDIGLEDYLYSGNYCFMEWPALVLDYLPLPYVEVKILHTDSPDTREILTRVIS